ncbi:hypothetical protein ABIB06_000902 [Bradyrhizobium sp. LB8.2]
MQYLFRCQPGDAAWQKHVTELLWTKNIKNS